MPIGIAVDSAFWQSWDRGLSIYHVLVAVATGPSQEPIKRSGLQSHMSRGAPWVSTRNQQLGARRPLV